MSGANNAVEGHVTHPRHRGGVPQVHATRAPTPRACGCGLPVAFDVESHAFFCIGCGSTKECTCRRSLLSATVRPVNVV